MLTTEQIYFLELNPAARQLLYRSLRLDQVYADQMFRFLREAYTRHFPVTLTVEVQGVSAAIDISFDNDGPGWELYNYLGPWVASMALKDGVRADQMASIWPELPEWYKAQAKNEASQIDPEGGKK